MVFIIKFLVIGLSNEKNICINYITLSIINLLSFQSTTWQTCGISSLVDCLSESNPSTNDWCGNCCYQNHTKEWQRHESRTTWCKFSINSHYLMTPWRDKLYHWSDYALITLGEWEALLNNYYVLKFFFLYFFLYSL